MKWLALLEHCGGWLARPNFKFVNACSTHSTPVIKASEASVAPLYWGPYLDLINHGGKAVESTQVPERDVRRELLWELVNFIVINKLDGAKGASEREEKVAKAIDDIAKSNNMAAGMKRGTVTSLLNKRAGSYRLFPLLGSLG